MDDELCSESQPAGSLFPRQVILSVFVCFAVRLLLSCLQLWDTESPVGGSDKVTLNTEHLSSILNSCQAGLNHSSGVTVAALKQSVGDGEDGRDRTEVDAVSEAPPDLFSFYYYFQIQSLDLYFISAPPSRGNQRDSFCVRRSTRADEVVISG